MKILLVVLSALAICAGLTLTTAKSLNIQPSIQPDTQQSVSVSALQPAAGLSFFQ